VNPLVGVLILVLLGLLGARLGFDPARTPLGPRLLLATGTHFLLLGLLLGPGLGLLTPTVMGQLQPLMALGLGWIGLLFGLQLDRDNLAQFPPAYFLFAAAQAVITFLLFAGAAWLGLHLTRGVGTGAPEAILTTAATAAVSTPAGIALISRTFKVQGPLTRFLFYIASLDAVVGIVALQVTYAVYHPSTAIEVAGFGWGVWLAIAVAAGIVFGIFFLWLTRPKPERDELSLFLLGLVVFEAGTALYLGVSPLFVATITGAVIANLSPLRRRVYTVLQTWEKAVYVVLLILAGALLGVSGWLVLPLAAAYLGVRTAGKLVGGLVARRVVPLSIRPPATLGMGLVPQGGISLAMALSAALTYGALTETGEPVAGAVRLAFGTIVVAVAASELVGPFLTRGLLRDAGEITPRLERELESRGE
jgi:Kef-type K+ transport system membrane component KefB